MFDVSFSEALTKIKEIGLEKKLSKAQSKSALRKHRREEKSTSASNGKRMKPLHSWQIGSHFNSMIQKGKPCFLNQRMKQKGEM